jgi:hypothetical protein
MMRKQINLAVALVLLSATAAISGCGSTAPYFAQLFFPEQVKASFDLQDKLTLVLVEDPQVRFDNSAIADRVADRIMNDLKKAKVVRQFVPLQRLRDQMAAVGNDYDGMAISRIGREVGAAQVIYVHIDSVRMAREPGMWHPKAKITVKVIDAVNGKRIFPVAQPSAGALGVTVTSETQYRYNTGERSDMMALVRQLAQSVGRDAAFLFYDHQRPRLGD